MFRLEYTFGHPNPHRRRPHIDTFTRQKIIHNFGFSLFAINYLSAVYFPLCMHLFAIKNEMATNCNLQRVKSKPLNI